MSIIALSHEGARALTDLAHGVQAASAGCMHAYSDLKNSFSSARGQLGDLEDDVIQAITQAERTVETVQEATQAIPNILNDTAEQIERILKMHITVNP